jgi:acyl carrier protein
MIDTKASLDPAVLRVWMFKYIGSVLDIPSDSFSGSATFDTYGMDSAEAVIMAGVMEEEFRVQIDPRLFFEHPSVDELANALAELELGPLYPEPT